MDWVAARAFGVCFWALIYWGSIKVLDRDNAKNRFGVALGIGLLYTFSFMFPLPGFLMIGVWLVLLIRLTMWQYELDLIPSSIATAATVFVPYFLVPYLGRFVAESHARAYALIYGLPAITLVVYAAMRFRSRHSAPKVQWADKKSQPGLPEARVEAIGKPVSAPIVAPPKYDPGARLGEKPSLLT
ncbi:hypothetical protein BH11MYX1_BH11MYX1_00180 [soil metagenome]